MMFFKKIITIVLLVSLGVVAKTTVLCKSYYESKLGWGDGAIVEVSFYDGGELNEATGTYKYYGTYATIWFSNKSVAIIKLNSWSRSLRSSFEREDLVELFDTRYSRYVEGEQVNSDNNKKWRIEAKEEGNLRFETKWIDPRMN